MQTSLMFWKDSPWIKQFDKVIIRIHALIKSIHKKYSIYNIECYEGRLKTQTLLSLSGLFFALFILFNLAFVIFVTENLCKRPEKKTKKESEDDGDKNVEFEIEFKKLLRKHVISVEYVIRNKSRWI